MMRIAYLRYIPLFWLLFVYPFCSRMDAVMPNVTGDFGLIISLVIWIIVTSKRDVKWGVNGLDISFVAFVLYHFCLTAFRYPYTDPWQGIRVVEILLLYYYFRSVDVFGSFFKGLFVAGIIQVVWGFLQSGGVLPGNNGEFPMTGCFFNPALLGLSLVLAFGAGFAMCRETNRRMGQGVLMSGMLLLLAGIVCCHSRAAWLALFAGCVWWLGVGSRNRLSGLFKKRGYVQLLMVGTVMFVGILAYGLYVVRPLSVHGRFLIWRVIAKNIPDAWLFGHGPLQARYMPMQAEWLQLHPESSLGMLAGNNVFAFNEFLRVLFESGIVGWMLLLLLSGMVLVYGSQGDGTVRMAGVLVVALAVFALFSYPFEAGWIVFVGVAIIAIVSRNGRLKKHVFKCTPSMKWGVRLVAGSFFVYAVFMYCVTKKADLLLPKAYYDESVFAEGKMEGCFGYLRGNADFVPAYGKVLYDCGLYAEALPVLEEAFHLKPSSDLVCDLGDCYQRSGEFRKAEQAYLLASDMTPAYIFPQYCLFCLYRDIGETEKAMAKAVYILEMPVKVVNTSVLRYRNQARIFIKENTSSK